MAGLPELTLDGLDDRSAHALLAAAMPGAIDNRVQERIVAEVRGNPLALLELHTELTPIELAGGYGLAGGPSLDPTHREQFHRPARSCTT
ncbi:MAG: hypothetical protein QOK02_4200 [Mycobacterium sp.]|nr:hypothetical protein [Mycobacterium sp.]